MPKITIRVANAEKLETQFLPELATGALFIRSDKFLPLGAEVDIDLYLPSATEALPLKGRVNKITDDPDARARKATGMTLAVDASREPTRSRLDALYAAYNITPSAPELPSQPPPRFGANVIALPPPSTPSQPEAIALPAPTHSAAAAAEAPPPPPPASTLDSEALFGPPSPEPEVPSVGPAIPSIAPVHAGARPPPLSPPSIAPLGAQVPVVRFDKPRNGLDDHPPPLPQTDLDPSEKTPAQPTSVADLAATAVPSFDVLHKAAATPPPLLKAVESHDGRVKELESELAQAKEQARKASIEKEAAAARHGEELKRLNQELESLRRAGGGGRSPIPAALAGLVIGAAASAGVLLAMPMTSTAQPEPVKVAAVAKTPEPPPEPAKPPVEEPVKPADPVADPTVKTGTDVAAVAAVESAADAGALVVAAKVEEKPNEVKPAVETQPAEVQPAEVKPAEVKPADVKPAELKPQEPPTELVAANAAEKPAPKVRKGPEPLTEEAGTLSLRSDMPSVVYVNGRKVGDSPAKAKANPGKVTVRFDCIVEDVKMRGKNKTVNLEPNGALTIDHACIE